MFRNYQQKVLDFVWRTDLNSQSALQRRLIQALQIAHCVIRDLLDGMLTLRAMSLVYTTLLSLVPLIAVSFSVLKGFGVHNQIEPMLLGLMEPLGEKGREITFRIIEFVENTKAGVLGFLGLILLFYTVVSLIQKIEGSFNFTWRISKSRSLKQRFSNYLSVVLLGPLLIFSALGIMASVMGSDVVRGLMEIDGIGWLITLFAKLVPYMLIILAFMVIYIFVPNTRVTVKAAFAGAFVAGILWETVGWAFASFVVNSAKYTAIYSAFATLIFFMIWLYLCWMILLIGASIAFYVQHPEYRKPDNRAQQSSIRMKEKLALLAMTFISRVFYEDDDPVDEKVLAEELQIVPVLLSPIIDQLLSAKLLLRTDGDHCGLVPAYPPEKITVLDVLNAIREAGEETDLSYSKLPKEDKVDVCLANIQSIMEQEFSTIDLKQLALNDATINRRVLT